ncbi:AAA family ATPase [Thermanaerosceptrum fracticalcis]|uniref:AAA family ATPase n=1 Tax=Thermanaerosceptrum fracticalcis TaxID=1712410 RepID=A0A7G6E6I5_THEFR|nr:ATP-binding protein [Thermanaerosceptrum fracticalcis]QNB47689.1 AAA family ATPase [Thermanaerosceptrum fracticalcis]
MNKFVNRENELTFLQSEYIKRQSSLVIIYGRRRIGKTSLIKKFIQDKSALYFLASEEPERENINSFKNLLAEFTGNILLRRGSDFSWDDLFTVFRDYNSNYKKILVIDEFQYLGKANSAFPSIFQRIWDQILKDSYIMVILCGSLIHMMESQTLAYSSPLYGRRTGQIKLKQIPFLHYGEFYGNKSEEELIQYYAVTGGVPKYIEVFRDVEDVYEGIQKNILTRQSFLYEEPIFLLEKEVSEIGSYFSIIKTIAQGNHKLGSIAAALGVSQTSLTKYLNTMINLDLIQREVPITEKNPEKSKKGLYFIKDNFIEFWFKFIYPYRNYLEMDNTEYVMEKIKNNFIDNHVSFVYEKICMEKLWKMNDENFLNFKILKLGKWWRGSEKIDFIGLNEDSKDIVFCECKYHDKPVDGDVFYDLLQKAKQVDWYKKERKEQYVLFSKSGFTHNLLSLADKRKDLILVFGVRLA